MNERRSLLRNDGLQTFVCSIICIILGLIIGYLALLVINAEGALEAIVNVIKNFFKYPSGEASTLAVRLQKPLR